MNAGYLANLAAVEVTGQRALQVTAGIAVHDKHQVINIANNHSGTHSGDIVTTRLVQCAAPQGLGPVPGHHVKVRLRVVLGAVQVDVNAACRAAFLEEDSKCTCLGKLLRLEPKFPGSLLPRPVGHVDVRVIGEPQIGILRAVKPDGGADPFGVQGSHTQFRPVDVCRVRIADCTSSPQGSRGVVKLYSDRRLVHQDVYPALGDSETVVADTVRAAAFAVGQLHGVVSRRQVIAMVINH